MSRPRLIRDAKLALSMLTAVSAGPAWPRDERPQAAAWFPAIGALFGVVAYGVIKVAALLDEQVRASYLLAVFIVIIWALLSRMLEWRGLTRVADALLSARESETRLEIASHGRPGAFSIAVVTLVVAVEIGAIGRIVGRPHELAVLLVPVVSRFAATTTAWLGVPSPRAGSSRCVFGHPTTLAFVIGVAPLAGALTGMWLGYRVTGLVLGAFGLLLAFGIPHLLARPFDGATGATMGASVLLTETALFIALALVV